MIGLVLGALLLGGCTRGSHTGGSSSSQPPTTQQSASDPVENEYNSLDQDLQTLNNQLKTPVLPAENP